MRPAVGTDSEPGEFLLRARVCDPRSIDASAARVAELQRIVEQTSFTREPQMRIVVRGDSGFCRAEFRSTWCEANRAAVRAGHLRETAPPPVQAADVDLCETWCGGQSASTMRSDNGRLDGSEEVLLRSATLNRDCSHDADERVVAKAEQLEKGENPRFVGDAR